MVFYSWVFTLKINFLVWFIILSMSHSFVNYLDNLLCRSQVRHDSAAAQVVPPYSAPVKAFLEGHKQQIALLQPCTATYSRDQLPFPWLLRRPCHKLCLSAFTCRKQSQNSVWDTAGWGQTQRLQLKTPCSSWMSPLPLPYPTSKPSVYPPHRSSMFHSSRQPTS